MPRARECEHIGPGEKTFACIPMSHCSFSLIKGAMRTADKTYGFDFSFSSNGGLYHESQSHQTKPLAVLHLIHLVCVTDKVNFRAILPTLLLMDPLGVGSWITSFADICKQSFSGNATDVGVWNPLTSNYRKLKEYLIIPTPLPPHRDIHLALPFSRYQSEKNYIVDERLLPCCHRLGVSAKLIQRLTTEK